MKEIYTKPAVEVDEYETVDILTQSPDTHQFEGGDD